MGLRRGLVIVAIFVVGCNAQEDAHQDASIEGFMCVVVDGDTFTGQFIDRNGALEFERSFER